MNSKQLKSEMVSLMRLVTQIASIFHTASEHECMDEKYQLFATRVVGMLLFCLEERVQFSVLHESGLEDCAARTSKRAQCVRPKTNSRHYLYDIK